VWLVHLLVMDAKTTRSDNPDHPHLHLVEQVLSLSELCAHLHVSAQTIYDLRSQGRGPRGFRVGRELRFRISEIEAWLERMEHLDDQRHSIGGQ
jgi:excisionase family DNA binding protein